MHYTMWVLLEPEICIDYDGEAPFSIVGMGEAAGVGFFRVSGKL